MSEIEPGLKHGIKTPEQAEARFKRLGRVSRARIRLGQSIEDLVPEIRSLDVFLANNNPRWRSMDLMDQPKGRESENYGNRNT